MKKHYVTLIVGTAVLLFAQLVALNHFRLFGYLLPVFYLYPLLKLPLEAERWAMVLFGAISGFVLDLLMNTPGLNLAATTLAAYFRKNILFALIPSEVLDKEDGLIVPGAKEMKPGRYLLYLLILTAIHIATLTILEAFSLRVFNDLLLYMVGSVFFTLVVYVILDLFFYRRGKD